MLFVILLFMMPAAFFLCFFIINIISSRAQKKAQKEAIRYRLDLAQRMAGDFERIGWTMWGAGAHLTDEQTIRMKRAALSDKMKLIEYHPDFHCAIVEGEHGTYYHIDEFGCCSCPDFEKRQLPCKHIYFAFLRIMDLQDNE